MPGNEKVALHYWKWRKLICSDDNGLQKRKTANRRTRTVATYWN